MSNNQLHRPRTQYTIDKLDIFDTLAVSKYLKRFHFTDSQAEALSGILKKNQNAMVLNKDAMEKLATKADIAKLEARLEAKIADLSVQTIKWQVGTIIVLSSIFIALLKF